MPRLSIGHAVVKVDNVVAKSPLIEQLKPCAILARQSLLCTTHHNRSLMGPMALVDGKNLHIIQRDMTADLKGQVLLRLTEALQDEDANALRDFELYRGWGDVIYVRIHTGISPSFEHRNRLRSKFEAAASRALSPNRHSVEIRWSR